MKASKWIIAGFALVFLICLGAKIVFWCNRDAGYVLCDITFRHNEISCSHTGINPFLIWNGETTSAIYRGMSRPDLPQDDNLSKRVVHSYPPWHTSYFWFYGWLSPSCVKWGISLLNIFILMGSSFFLWRISFQKIDLKFLFLFVGTMSLSPGIDAFMLGNYGIMLLGLLLLLFWALEKRHDVLAGVCWAIMMIKPQVAVLLFWGLLFQKRYTSIIVAVILCILATLWPSYVYGCNPFSLILQISKIGEPYICISYGTPLGIFCKAMGDTGKIMFPLICFFLCGIFSYSVRNCRAWILRFMPALLIFPYWTYSQAHDRIVQIPMFVMILCLGFISKKPSRINSLMKYSVCTMVWLLMSNVWSAVLSFETFHPSILIYRLFILGEYIFMLWTIYEAVMTCKEELNLRKMQSF